MSGRRRLKPWKVRGSRSYTVKELAGVLDRDVETILRWIRDGNLPVISNRRPFLLDGDVVKNWIASRQVLRRSTCAFGELYCMRCRLPRPARQGSVKVRNGQKIAKICAVCQACGTSLHRIASFRESKDWIALSMTSSPPENTLVKEAFRRSNAVLGRPGRNPPRARSKGEQLELMLSGLEEVPAQAEGDSNCNTFNSGACDEA